MLDRSRASKHDLRARVSRGYHSKTCQHIQMSNDKNSNHYFHDRWVWSDSGGCLGCAMGYWMPWGSVGTDQVPTPDECQQTIYSVMTHT